MSYDETHIGKLIRIKDSAEDIAKSLCDEENISKEEGKSYVETAEENNLGYPKYIIKNGQVWMIEESYYALDDPYVFYHKINNDNTIDYVFTFNNGGTCFHECLEEIFIDDK